MIDRRHLRDIVLLPIALMVVVLEDVVWAGLQALLRRLVALKPVRQLGIVLGGLPGWAALPLFLVPEAIGKVGEVWAVALLVGGNLVAAVLVYIGVRITATMVAVFVYQACKTALLRYRWFATLVDWVHRVRDWAVALMAPWRERLRHARTGLVARVTALRRAYAITRFRPRSE